VILLSPAQSFPLMAPNVRASQRPGVQTLEQPKGEKMSKTTAVATLYSKSDAGLGQTALAFSADYNDERNKEWSKYTPALGVNMTVIDSVAERFEQGKTYLLTFEAK
jgi:hypothetical protein